MNYTEVKKLALDYSDRSDASTINNMDNFLLVVESRVNRLLSVQKMVIRTFLNMIEGQEYYGLPSDFTGLRDIEFQSISPVDGRARRKTLQYVTPEVMNLQNTEGANVESYTIVADQLQIYPPKDGDILEIIYYRKVTPLSAANVSNWLSDNNPDIYLFGLMVEINSFVKDSEAKQLWEQRFQEALLDLIVDDSVNRWGGTPLQTRIFKS